MQSVVFAHVQKATSCLCLFTINKPLQKNILGSEALHVRPFTLWQSQLLSHSHIMC